MGSQVKAEEMLNLPRSVWKKVGGKAVTKIKQDSQKGFGTNESGKRYKFKSYTDEYASKKAAGDPSTSTLDAAKFQNLASETAALETQAAKNPDKLT